MTEREVENDCEQILNCAAKCVVVPKMEVVSGKWMGLEAKELVEEHF